MHDPTPKPWITYLLECADGSLYCGITNDLEVRLAAHNSGRGARYTRGRGPCAVVHVERHPSKGDALRREAAIKKLSRAAKRALARFGAGARAGVGAELTPMRPKARRTTP